MRGPQKIEPNSSDLGLEALGPNKENEGMREVILLSEPTKETRP